MNLKITSKQINFKLLFFIVILSQLSLLVFLMNNKVGFYGDEIHSYSLSNSQFGIIFEEYGKPTYNCYYKWNDGKLFKDYITVKKDKKFDYKNVYHNQTLDSHPPLFYFLIHSICSFFPEKFSKWYGFSLNIIVFIFTQIFLYIIAKKLFNSEIYALLSCFIYGFSSGALDCFLYIRMYSVLTFFYLLLLYIYLCCLNAKCSIYKFLSILIVVFLGGLTQYHFYIFAFFITLVFITLELKKRNYKMFWLVSLAALLGVVFSLIYYPYLFIHLTNSPRGTEALNLQNRISPCVIAFSFIFQEFFGLNSKFSILLSIVFIISIFIYFVLFYTKKYLTDSNSYFLLISSSTFVYIIFLYLTIDYKLMGITLYGRYFFSIFPVITLIFVYLLLKFKKVYLFIFILFSVLSNLSMLDFYYPFTNEEWSGVLNFEELIRNNNLIIYCNRTGILQTICPQLAKCNKIYINPFNDPNKIGFPKQIHPNSKPTYLFIFPCNKFKNIPFTKVVEGYLWKNKFEVYDLN